MTAFSPEAHEFHEQLAEDYLSRLCENDVENAEAYFAQMDAFEDGRITEIDEVREFLANNEMPLEAFYRVAPTNDQDVMMATLNPGMKDEIDLLDFTEKEFDRHISVGSDFEAKAGTVAQNLRKYLTRSDNRFSDLIQILRSELDVMDDSVDLDDYLNYDEDSPMNGFFGDICYTWMYKLSTPDDDYIPGLGSLSKSEAREHFAEEIFEVVEPKVLVSVSKHGWETVWEYLDRNYSESPEELIEGFSESVPVTKGFNSTFGEGAYAGLFYVEVEDLWIITTWHAAMWIKSDELRKNAEMLNKELNS